MKIKEIRTLPDDEIASEIDKARAKVFKMRFQAKSENVENPGSLKTLRRQVARMKTVLRERARAAGAARVAPAGESPSRAAAPGGGA